MTKEKSVDESSGVEEEGMTVPTPEPSTDRKDSPEEAELEADAGEETEAEEAAEESTDAPVLMEEPDPIALLEAEKNDLELRLRKVSSGYRELQDEMKAYRERTARQQSFRLETYKGEAIGVLFEPLANLERSIQAARDAGMDTQLLDGLEMVQRSFMEGFHRLGLEEVPAAEGDAMDPQIHEVLSVVPIPNPLLSGKILQVFSKGYRIGKRLLRPAKVIVGHDPNAEEAEEAELLEAEVLAASDVDPAETRPDAAQEPQIEEASAAESESEQ